ncbi:hypothetical protein F5884DRAFT_786302 [Xylogone sp. PMI_703]|nr:hypothetical protein F5884DRAFT_786302 [Xylogone sp. PMI_703]
MDTSSPTPPPTAPRVCLACKKQKRRCDKILPSCSPCASRSQACTYSDAGEDDIAVLRSRLGALEERLRVEAPYQTPGEGSSAASVLHSHATTGPVAEQLDGFISYFPPIYFLDAAAFNLTKTIIPRPFLSTPQELQALLGTTNEVQDVVDSFFQTVHVWLPVVWRRPFASIASLTEPRADMALLIACMKLIVELPPSDGQPSQWALYALAKNFSFYAESSGLLTIHILQAIVLIAIYEIGHGIYPAAYMSVGRAARLGIVMGLRGKSSQRVYANRTSRGENEEERRVWYAIIILDRLVNIGFPGHPLCSGDFSHRDLLPCDTQAWDRGELAPNEPVFVASSTIVNANSFGRLCQIALLLGRVIEHRNEIAELRAVERFQNAMQLHRTIDALLLLLSQEFRADPRSLCIPIALGFTTKIILHEIYSCTGTNHGESTVEETQMLVVSIEELKKFPTEVVKFLNHLEENGIQICDTGPFICDCLYQAAATLAWFVRESGDSHLEAMMNQTVEALEVLSTRWNIAAHYLNVMDSVRISTSR